MVIKFFCRCGKKVSVPDDKRDMKGKCPQCNGPISLKDADPAAIQREPMMIVKIDSSPCDRETAMLQ